MSISLTRSLTFVLAVSAFLSSARAAEEKADPVSTAHSSGDYQTAWLKLEQGAAAFDGKSKEKIDLPLFLGLREGKAVAAWFAHPATTGPRIFWLDAATLQLAGGKLSGNLAGRTNLNWGEKNVHDYVYQIEAAVDSQRRIAGSFTATYTDDAGVKTELSGKLSGELLSPEQVAANQLPAGKNWPHYYGDGAGFAGPKCDAKLVAGLALARPVWKSEAFIPTAYGSAPDSRYFDRAGRTDSGGGASSPLVVDGRVYQFFYYPRGPVGLDKAYAKYESEAELTAIAKQLFPQREIQQRAVMNHFRTQADETLVCLDAATGGTLWKTTFPQRGNNYQTHKHRGHFPTALIAGGTIYQPGTTGRLYAVEAATGKLLWEYPDAEPTAFVTKQGGIDCHAPSPVLVGDIVAFAAGQGVTGVDAKSGKKVWHQPLWQRSSLMVWKGDEKPLIIASDRKHETKQNFAVALDPATGSIAWKAEVPYLLDYGFPLLAENLLLGYSLKLDNVKPGENDGLAIIHAFEITPTGLKPAWSTPPLAPIIDTVGLASDGRHVHVSAAKELFCLNLKNGEQLASLSNIGGARTQTLAVTDGHLLLQPEGRHGRQSFFLVNADPRQLQVLGGSTKGTNLGHAVGAEHQWTPPHAWTTAYANQPIVYPLVDGRLFIRGLDAIYCYDLRAKLD